MPKYRSIHLKITQSFDFNEMPDDFTRLVWVLLPLELDSEGRGIYDFSWIKSKVFPLRKDISERKIKRSMEWFFSRKDSETNLGMIEIYEVGNRQFFYIPTFKQYQRGLEKEAASILPAPQLVDTEAIITPELLPTKSRSEAKAKSKAKAKSNENKEEEVRDDLPHQVSEELIILFEKCSNIKRPPEQEELGKWITSLSEILSLGGTNDIINLACKELTQKKYVITGPWSIKKAVGVIVSRRARQKNPLRDSEGDFGQFINH